MSKKTAVKTNANENQLYDDDIEDEFLKCKLEDIPLPKKELEEFEFEVIEVMKSGCNLQIAEYSLLKCNIKELETLKKKYNNYKDKIKEKMKDDIKLYFNNKLNGTQIITYDEEQSNYEEEAMEIMEEYKDKIESNEILLKDLPTIKKDLTNIFEDNVKKNQNKDVFLEAQKNYREKREAFLEAALRLVKKIINDDKEYKKFHDEYLNKKKC